MFCIIRKLAKFCGNYPYKIFAATLSKPHSAKAMQVPAWTLGVVLTLVGSGSVLAAEKTLEFDISHTTVTGLSRETSNSPLQISTPTGKVFTQTGKPFRLKTGDAELIVAGDGRLEALLLSHVGRPATLILSRGVDGLVVGAVFDDGQAHLEPLSIRND